MSRGGKRLGAGRPKKATGKHVAEVTSEKPFVGAAYVGARREKEISVGTIDRASLWDKYDQIYRDRCEVSAALLYLAGHTVSRGYVTIPINPTDQTALKAKILCDNYARSIDLDFMVYTGTIELLKHGTLFLENLILDKKLVSTRVFPWQSEIQPSKMRSDGEFTKYRQVRQGMKVTKGDKEVSWTDKEIITLRMPPIDKDGFGSSLVGPVTSTLNIKAQLFKDIAEYMKKTVWPKEKWTLGTDADKVDKPTVDDVRSKVENWEAGEVFVSNFKADYQACGVGPVESRMFPELINTVNNSAVDGLMVPPVSYQRNATEASAREMSNSLRIALVQPIQRLWKRCIEGQLFKLLLEGEGILPEFTPQISFTPPTEDELLLRAQRITMIKNAGIASDAWARNQLDIPEEARYIPGKPGEKPPKPTSQPSEPKQPPEEEPPKQEEHPPEQETLKETVELQSARAALMRVLTERLKEE